MKLEPLPKIQVKAQLFFKEKIMYKIFVIFFVSFALAGCSSMVKTKIVKDDRLSEYESVQFIKGMKGTENIYLDNHTSKIYVTDLSGVLYLLDKDENDSIKIIKSLKLGKCATGITQGKDGYLYVNASEYGEEGWLKYGGAVYKVDKELKSYKGVTGLFKGINGLCTDDRGNLYFAIGDLEFFFPDGAIYKMSYNQKLKKYNPPELHIDKLGSANGLFYSNYYKALILTETFSKVSMVNLDTKAIKKVFDKSKLIEGFDDVCVDSKGRFWVAEPTGGFIKMFDPKNQKLTRYHMDGVGVASSCRTRINNSKEYLYITEREIEKKNDGRGLIVISIDELENR